MEKFDEKIFTIIRDNMIDEMGMRTKSWTV